MKSRVTGVVSNDDKSPLTAWRSMINSDEKVTNVIATVAIV
jgi:hypothetical protein